MGERDRTRAIYMMWHTNKCINSNLITNKPTRGSTGDFSLRGTGRRYFIGRFIYFSLVGNRKIVALSFLTPVWPWITRERLPENTHNATAGHDPKQYCVMFMVPCLCWMSYQYSNETKTDKLMGNIHLWCSEESEGQSFEGVGPEVCSCV